MEHIYNIKAGTVKLTSIKEREELDNILSFACRENPKRHFILVNKLIGRYSPTTPKVMRDTYNRLAEQVGPGAESYVISFAEAATGLGAGVADSLTKIQNNDVYFQHTTRHQLPYELWFTVDEAHSHAVNHMFYKPESELFESITKSKRLVIVDDEITTGRTIKVLLLQILPYLKELEEIVIVSIINLMSEKGYLKEADIGIPIRYISLVEADLSIESNPDFTPELPKKVDSQLTQSDLDPNVGRRGLRMPYTADVNEITCTQSAVVIANGEHQYIPFLLAEKLEKTGVDVVFQTINRSPIMECDEIKNKHIINVSTNGTEHYLYNFFPQDKSVFIIGEHEYEGLVFTNEAEYHEWRR